jgi:phosphocarrier protein HPr
MLSRSFDITNKKGLHARAAAKLVKIVAAFSGTQVHIVKLSRPNGLDETTRVITSSVLGMLMLAAEKGSTLTFEADGPQAAEALIAIGDLMARKFDEDA